VAEYDGHCEQRLVRRSSQSEGGRRKAEAILINCILCDGYRGVYHRARIRATRWLHPSYELLSADPLARNDVGEHRSPDGAQRNPGITRRRPRIARSLSSGGASRRPVGSIRATAVVICPSGGLLTGLSSLISDFPKNISVPTYPKSILELSPSRPTEGRIRIVRDAGWDAVDAAAFCARRGCRAGWRKACERSPSERTRDVAAYGEVVWS